MALAAYSPDIISYLVKGLRFWNGSRERLKKYQKEKLKSLLLHGYNYTKYYREVLGAANVVKNNAVYLENLTAIPVLTKDIIKERFEDLLASNFPPGKKYTNYSGGSTGFPVKLVQDKSYYSKMVADTILFSQLNGKYAGQPELKIWGSERDIEEGSIGLKSKIINFFFNRTLVNSFVLNETLIKDCINKLNKTKPVSVWTYVDSIYEISKFIAMNSLKVHQPKVIICTAGTMYEFMRDTIQNAFPFSKIRNQYGSREVGIIGIESDDNHEINLFDHSIFSETVYEDVNTKHHYEEGKILVTPLNNYSMPLIRFDIGDKGIIKDTGIKAFSQLCNLEGRVNSHLKASDGKLLHGEYITHLFYNRDWLKKFQVVQNSINEVCIYYELAKSSDDVTNELNEIALKIKNRLGNEVQVKYCEVDTIPKLNSGKFQFVISKIT